MWLFFYLVNYLTCTDTKSINNRKQMNTETLWNLNTDGSFSYIFNSALAAGLYSTLCVHQGSPVERQPIWDHHQLPNLLHSGKIYFLLSHHPVTSFFTHFTFSSHFLKPLLMFCSMNTWVRVIIRQKLFCLLNIFPGVSVLMFCFL